MNRKEAVELLPIIKAYAEGKEIEIFDKTTKMWRTAMLPHFDCDPKNYRIKPGVKYRPFANVEECWTEMKKHQPFGWVKDKKDGYYVLITAVDNGDYMSLSGNSGWSFYSLMKDYTFTDDIPFGIKVE